MSIKGGIFLTVKDLMKLTGNTNYSGCAGIHRTIRDSLGTGKKKLTIKEYCDYEQIEFPYVWQVLRG